MASVCCLAQLTCPTRTTNEVTKMCFEMKGYTTKETTLVECCK